MAARDHQSPGPARVRRPLGVSIALVATALLYGAVPLVEIYFIRRLSMTASEAYFLGGADTDQWTWIEGAVGALIVLLCGLTWWGRPAWMRHVLVTVVLAVTAVTLYRIYQAFTTTVNPIFDGQAQSTLRGFLVYQLPALIVVPLYTAWYLNRAPARAFYHRIPLAEVTSRWASDVPASPAPADPAEPPK